MWKYLNKGISTPLAIAIILVFGISVTAFCFWQNLQVQKEELAIAEMLKSTETIVAPVKKSGNNLESICLGSGGAVSNSFCCKTADDFPDTCLIGACGCSPENSKEVKICDCGPEKCFSREKGCQ